MSGEIFLADPDDDQRSALCSLLRNQRYKTVEVPNFLDLSTVLSHKKQPIVILNLDSEGVNSQFLRGLTRGSVRLHIIGLSERMFHPELKEAMSKHISVCLSSPVDPEELLYWIRCVLQNNEDCTEATNH